VFEIGARFSVIANANANSASKIFFGQKFDRQFIAEIGARFSVFSNADTSSVEMFDRQIAEVGARLSVFEIGARFSVFSNADANPI
jgi:hypothetical protein